MTVSRPRQSHELAQELLNLPDLPVFIIGSFSEELEEPLVDVDTHGWTEYEDGERVWRTGQAILIH